MLNFIVATSAKMMHKLIKSDLGEWTVCKEAAGEHLELFFVKKQFCLLPQDVCLQQEEFGTFQLLIL
jgi:hypothetical protein